MAKRNYSNKNALNLRLWNWLCQFSSKCWTYLEAREPIIAEFGSEAFVAFGKDAVMCIKLKKMKVLRNLPTNSIMTRRS